MSFLSEVQTNVTARSPGTTQDSRFDVLVGIAETQINATVYGNHRAYAGALLVLHWIALEDRGTGAAGGAVKSEKEGQLARSYSDSMVGKNAYLSQTHWGMELARLQKTLIFNPRNRMMGPD